MDYLGEAICFSIDCILFGVCLKSYLRHKKTLEAVKIAPECNIDARLKTLLYENNGSYPYIAIHGNVKAVGPAITSINNSNITGVVQKLTKKEHVIARGSCGFWSESERTLNVAFNTIPFMLSNEHKFLELEVIDALSAEILDLEVVSEKYDDIKLGFWDHIWGFLTGVRRQGLQTIEEMVRDGSYMTVVGEVNSDNGVLKIQPPTSDLPFFITKYPFTLVKRLQDNVKVVKWFTIGFGVVGVFICLFAWGKYMNKLDAAKKIEDERKKNESTRRMRRSQVRPQDELPDEKKCVVCWENPRELVLIPCGHVCLCEDCSERIQTVCPVCNSPIILKNPAYIA